ncbi:MAG: hypothetical protein IJK93_07535 [Muribaculaceae bacterium]|nr:hypothetical protein [Muribaculaceae bacterium]
MKTYRYIIALVAILMPIVANANIYESRIKEALEGITQNANCSSLGLTYCTHDDPETNQKDGELQIVKFKIGGQDAYLIDRAISIYQQINEDSKKERVPYLYTMWWNTANDDKPYSGVRLYYSPENSILVGADADNCYTVGFFLSENTDYRNTYTLEWSDTNGDSVMGRVITTFGPIASKAHSMSVSTSGTWTLDDYDIDTDAFNAQMEKLQAGMARFNEGMERLKSSTGSIVITSSTGAGDAKDWMKKLLFYLDKIQRDGKDSRYIYLSKLYELCKNTECLDQMDLKIALQQVGTCYKQMKSKKRLTENELLFLQNMGDLLESKIQ